MISTLVDPTTGCVLVDDSGDTRFIHTSNDVRVQKRAIRALLKTRGGGGGEGGGFCASFLF